jgi:hypothetical protein
MEKGNDESQKREYYIFFADSIEFFGVKEKISSSNGWGWLTIYHMFGFSFRCSQMAITRTTQK